MSSFNPPGEAEHLLGRHASLSDRSTTTPQDILRPTQHRPSISFESALEHESLPKDTSDDDTPVAGSALSEGSSTLTSQSYETTAGKDHTLGSDRTRISSMPWTLRRASLLGFIISLIILVVVLEVLYYLSNKHQGLATSGENIYYLWKYGPTASKSVSHRVQSEL